MWNRNLAQLEARHYGVLEYWKTRIVGRVVPLVAVDSATRVRTQSIIILTEGLAPAGAVLISALFRTGEYKKRTGPLAVSTIDCSTSIRAPRHVRPWKGKTRNPELKKVHHNELPFSFGPSAIYYVKFRALKPYSRNSPKLEARNVKLEAIEILSKEIDLKLFRTVKYYMTL